MLSKLCAKRTLLCFLTQILISLIKVLYNISAAYTFLTIKYMYTKEKLILSSSEILFSKQLEMIIVITVSVKVEDVFDNAAKC